MDFKFQEKIEVSISFEEVTELLKEKLLKEGYEATSFEPTYVTEHVNYGNPLYGESRQEKKLVGFKAKASRIQS